MKVLVTMLRGLYIVVHPGTFAKHVFEALLLANAPIIVGVLGGQVVDLGSSEGPSAEGPLAALFSIVAYMASLTDLLLKIDFIAMGVVLIAYFLHVVLSLTAEE
jgi:hypothetical protein